MTAGLLTGAGCFLLVAGVAASEVARLPRSTLYSKPQMPFTLSIERLPRETITVLIHDAVSVARMRFAPSPLGEGRGEGRVSIERLPLPKPDPELDIAVLERLYVLALRQETEARFCMEDVCGSQGALLQRLVKARASVLQRAGSKAGVPWRVITMTPAAAAGGTPDHVAARVTEDGRPLEGTTLFFNRAPHSSCSARADARGVATCKLIDQHGDEDSDHDQAAVVATYPGDVRADVVRVPLTLVIAK